MPTDARDVLRAAAILTGDRDYELLIEKPLRGPENVDAVIQRRLAVFLELTIPLQPSETLRSMNDSVRWTKVTRSLPPIRLCLSRRWRIRMWRCW